MERMRQQLATNPHLQKRLDCSKRRTLQVLELSVPLMVLTKESFDVFERGMVVLDERKDCLQFDPIEMQQILVCLGTEGVACHRINV